MNVYALAEVNPAIPVRELPSPEKDVAVTIPLVASIVIAVPTFIDVYAVSTPTVVMPVILTLPVNVAAVPVTILSVDATPVNPEPSPENEVAVTTPVTTAPSGKVGETPDVLPFKLVTLKLDIRDLRFEGHQ